MSEDKSEHLFVWDEFRGEKSWSEMEEARTCYRHAIDKNTRAFEVVCHLFLAVHHLGNCDTWFMARGAGMLKRLRDDMVYLMDLAIEKAKEYDGK